MKDKWMSSANGSLPLATHGFTEAHLQENESHCFNSQC